jgi:3-oxoacyl-[acyl-carrier protein] reductase
MTEMLGEKIQEEILKIVPLKDMGEVEEIANLALYLASPEARYITGQVIAIDGGMTM